MQLRLGRLGNACGGVDRQAARRGQSEVNRRASNRCLTNCIFLLHFNVFHLSAQVLEAHSQEMGWVHRAHQRQWHCRGQHKRLA
jgi:hypothetical protein